MSAFRDSVEEETEMKTQRVKLWILVGVCTFALLAPATTWASGDQAVGPVSLWQTLGRIWQSWTGWWTADSEEGTATEDQAALRVAAGSTDEPTSDDGSTIGVAPPAVDSLGLTTGDDPDTDGAPQIDPEG